MGISDLLTRNKKFRVDSFCRGKLFFQTLSKEQKPKYAFIACSDSRVSPEILFNFNLGEAFIYRNIGNCVTHDSSFFSYLYYVVKVLGLRNIVICGHYECGAIKLASTKEFSKLNTNPLVYSWLNQIRKNILKFKDNHKIMCEINVVHQMFNLYNILYKNNFLVKEDVIVHGLIYDVYEGIVREIDSVTFNPNDRNLDFYSNTCNKTLEIYRNKYNLRNINVERNSE